jgi:hypothetical protein
MVLSEQRGSENVFQDALISRAVVDLQTRELRLEEGEVFGE